MSKIYNKNITIKILALFISILLWSYVRGEVNPKSIREFKGVNVEFTNERILNDTGLIVLGDKDTKISVKISGRRSDINSIDIEDITAQVDLSGASKGTQRILIDVSVPFKVELEDISERYVNLEIDSLDTVEKSVDVNVSDKNNTIKVDKISPEVVGISGPSTLIKRVSKVVVDIDKKKIKESTVLKLPVKVIDKDGEVIEGLKTSPDMIEVSLSLFQLKEVPISVSLIDKVGSNIERKDITISPSTVNIRGLEKDIIDIKEIKTEELDLSRVEEGTSLELELIVPKEVLVEENITKVILTIGKGKNTTRIIPVSTKQIDLLNLGDGLFVSFYEMASVQNINVKLIGNAIDLNEVNPEDIKLELDLDGLEEGIHDLKLKYIPLKKLELESLDPNNIKVKIQES